jgi:glycosyltransferase involved in cell wall biosynthesis
MKLSPDQVSQLYRWRWKAMRLQEEAGKLEVEVEDLRRKEESIRKSLSWRMTEPLRRIESFWRAAKNRRGRKAGETSFDWTRRIPVRRGGGCIWADCSMTVRGKSSPGMRRVSGGIIRGAMEAGVPIVPVDLLDHAPRDASGFFRDRKIESPPISEVVCDAFLLLDASWGYLASLEPLLLRLREAGVPVFALIHDTIPLDHPDLCLPQVVESFGPWLDTVFRLCDGAVCVSETTAVRVRHHLAQRCPGRVGHFVVLPWLPGNESWQGTPNPEELVPPDDFILCVGTVEPRKNYGLLLQAVSQLWAEKSWPCRLVIVGERGWGTDDLIAALEKHEEWGRKLWWFEDATDAHVHALYHACRALALPSIDEGFSQPLSEAAAWHKPVVLSDISVFRERVLSGGCFFTPGDVASLQSALVEAAGTEAVAPRIQRTTWDRSARQLAELLAQRGS